MPVRQIITYGLEDGYMFPTDMFRVLSDLIIEHNFKVRCEKSIAPNSYKLIIFNENDETDRYVRIERDDPEKFKSVLRKAKIESLT